MDKKTETWNRNCYIILGLGSRDKGEPNGHWGYVGVYIAFAIGILQVMVRHGMRLRVSEQKSTNRGLYARTMSTMLSFYLVSTPQPMGLLHTANRKHPCMAWQTKNRFSHYEFFRPLTI